LDNVWFEPFLGDFLGDIYLRLVDSPLIKNRSHCQIVAFRRLLLFPWIVGIPFLCLLLSPNTAEAQFALSLERLQGRMVSHSVNNASMAGPVGGWQFQADWRMGNGWELQQKPRYIGLALYGFDMGDDRREKDYVALLGAQNDGLYARGGMVFAFAGAVGQQLSLLPKLDFRYQWATGVSYHTAYYNAANNPANLAISTRLNFAGQLRADLLCKLSYNSSLLIGGSISHFSNANYRRPNVGYNIVHGNLAWQYRLAPPTHCERKDGRFIQYPALFNRLSRSQVALRGGYRMFTLKEPYFFPILIGEWNHRISFYSSSVNKTESLDNNAQQHPPLHEWRYGLNMFAELPTAVNARHAELAAFARHLFRMGRFDLLLDLGVYLHRPMDGKTQFYNCLGFQYRLTDRWILQQRLKAHLNNADYLEWGLNYSF